MKDELRIVLIGKTGSGKSATGNSILEALKFKSEQRSTSITAMCNIQWTHRFDRKIVVVDTPGMFDTGLTNEQAMDEVKKSILMSAPGPHAFILVKQIDRFTREEQQTINLFKSQFGDDMLNYTIVLFTGKDQLQPGDPYGDEGDAGVQHKVEEELERFMQGDVKLKSFIGSCGNRFMAINNRSKEERQKDVQQLIGMIYNMVCENGGSFYTNALLKKAEAEVAKRDAEKRRELERKEEEKIRQIKATLNAEMQEKLDQVEKRAAARDAAMRKELERKEEERRIVEKEKKEIELKAKSEREAAARKARILRKEERMNQQMLTEKLDASMHETQRVQMQADARQREIADQVHEQMYQAETRAAARDAAMRDELESKEEEMLRVVEQLEESRCEEARQKEEREEIIRERDATERNMVAKQARILEEGKQRVRDETRIEIRNNESWIQKAILFVPRQIAKIPGKIMSALFN